MTYNFGKVFSSIPIFLILTFSIFPQAGNTLPGNVALAQDDTEEQEREFRANLTGQGVVPSIVTNGSGSAVFTSTEDGDEMEYELEIQGIEDVTNAHLHIGAMRNGPLLVTLYNVQTSGQPDDGGETLAEGTFTGEDFERSLPLRGQNITSLLDLIEEGEIYVDIHTLAYPKGELRGSVVETPVETVEEQ